MAGGVRLEGADAAVAYTMSWLTAFSDSDWFPRPRARQPKHRCRAARRGARRAASLFPPTLTPYVRRRNVAVPPNRDRPVLDTSLTPGDCGLSKAYLHDRPNGPGQDRRP